MKSDKMIGVVVPCYKVSRHVERVLDAMPEYVDHVIVVDDACPEGTGKQVENLWRSNIHVLFHAHNQGVGGAMVSGYRKALEMGMDVVVKVDGDGQMDPQAIDRLIDPLLQGAADYTKGNRFRDLQPLKKMPKVRLFGNSFLSFFTKMVSGYWHIMDPANGFTAITAAVLRILPLEHLEKRFFFETDLLIHLNFNRQVVIDVAIPAHYGDEVSNLSIRHTLATYPYKLLKGLLKRLMFKYYIYGFDMASIYLLLGIPLLLFGVSFGAYRWVVGSLTHMENSAGTVMLVALPIILGMQFLLQAIHIDMNYPLEKSKHE